MANPSSALQIARADPREPEAAALIGAMTEEVRATYNHKIDGHGDFKAEDVLVPGSGFLVGRVAGQAVACGAYRPLAPGVAEIKRMFVTLEHRGRGYSKAMLTTLERMAKESGYQSVRLGTRPLQTAAIALYEGTGYVRIPNYGSYVEKEDCLCYEKPLGTGGGE